MFNYLDNLRKKPDSYKKRFSILVSFLVVGLIFVVWLSVIYPDVRDMGKKKAEIRKDPTPANAFLGNMWEGFRSLEESYGNLGKTVSDLSNNIENYYYSTSTTNKTDEILGQDTLSSSSTASSTIQIEGENDLSTTTQGAINTNNSN
ncbi:MAG: hypothetical protein WC095_02155 [Candidatus Paceibacterota bacterium]